MRVLGRRLWTILAVWAVSVGRLAAQDASPPAVVPRMEETPPPPPRVVMSADNGVSVAPVPNSGYAGGGDQWDRMNYIGEGEAPTYDEPSPCIGGGCRDSEFTPFASTWQGVDIMSRTRARGDSLSTDVLPVLGRHTVFSAADIPFQVAPGYDEMVEGYLGRDSNNYDWFIQGGFEGFNDWAATETIVATSPRITDTRAGITTTHGQLNSFLNGAFPGLDLADRQTFHYDSIFDTAELNLVLRPHPRADRIVLYPNGQWCREPEPGLDWSFLAGVRYLDLDEGFTFRGAGTFVPAGGAPTAVSGRYFAHTANPMVGLQLGTAVTFREANWDLGLHFKAAPMINSALAESRIDTSDPIFGDQHESFRFFDTRVAALLDLGLLGTYRLNDAWAIRGGYDISWLTGVALAPVQRPSDNQVNAHATLFLQGLILAVEYRR